MLIGIDNRESAFREDDYVDHVIKIQITGNTVAEIDNTAQAAGLTSEQWLRGAIAAALEFRAIKRPENSILGL